MVQIFHHQYAHIKQEGSKNANEERWNPRSDVKIMT